jgi:hypothetical protein
LKDNYVFARAGSFEELYPEVDNINLEIKELINPGWKKPEKIYHFNNKSNTNDFYPCTNPFCLGSGFSISPILAKAIANKETLISTGEHCGSNESGGRPCLHFFRIEGEVKYKA